MSSKKRQAKDGYYEDGLEVEDQPQREGRLGRSQGPRGARTDPMEETNEATQSQPPKKKGDRHD